jgi:hypothetical protein
MSIWAMRACWGTVIGLWPAVTIMRDLLHPGWGPDASGAGALLAAACAVALLRASRRRGRHGRHRRGGGAEQQIDVLSAEYARRCDAIETAAQRDAAALHTAYRMLRDLSAAIGGGGDDHEHTQPQPAVRLSLVPPAKRRGGVQAGLCPVA